MFKKKKLLFVFVSLVMLLSLMPNIFSLNNIVLVGTDITGTIGTSSDGNIWAIQGINDYNVIGAKGIYSFSNNGNKFIIGYGSSGQTAFSYNGKIWINSYNTVSSSTVTSLVFTGTKFIQASTGKIGFSTDGNVWTRSNNDTAIFGASNDIYNLSYNGTRVVATAGLGVIAFSTDGNVWTRSFNDTTVFSTKPIKGIAFGNNRFVAGSTSTCYLGFSTDGNVWTRSYNDTNVCASGQIYSVSWNGSNFVAVGQTTSQGALVLFSPDGNVWTRSFNDTAVFGTPNGGLTSVVWNGTYFITGINPPSSVASKIGFSVDGNIWIRSNNDATIFGVKKFNVFTSIPAPALVPAINNNIPITNIVDVNFSYDSNFGLNNSTMNFYLTCNSTELTNFVYDINRIVDGVNTKVYTKFDVNGVVTTINLAVPSGSNINFVGQCTDEFGNMNSVSLGSFYNKTLNLIDESNGDSITTDDLDTFLIKRIYSIDGNILVDLNVTPATSFNFLGDASLVPLVFNFGYSTSNAPVVTRFIDVSKIVDLNIPVCVPVSPPLIASDFIQQQLVSNLPRTVSVYNTVTHCYDLIGDLVYAGENGYAQTFWTVNLPYELSTYYLGVKTVLSLLDGSVAYNYNLDTLLFSRNQVSLVIGRDTLVATGKINPLTLKPDLNIVEIRYHAFNQDNTELSLSIYNGSELLVSYTDLVTPNDLVYNFYYPNYPSVTDQNFLRVVVVSTRVNGLVNTVETYFNILGQQFAGKIDYSFAAVVSILFFLFGISLTSAGRTLGLFGILVCLISIGICAFALQYWWVQFLIVGYVICLIYMVLLGKQTTGLMF
jgi:hypothetical protein